MIPTYFCMHVYDVHMCICFLMFVGTCMGGFRRLTVYIFLNKFLHYMSQNLLLNPKIADLSDLANQRSLGFLVPALQGAENEGVCQNT